MTAVIYEVIKSDAVGYEACALGHSIFSPGEAWDDLKEMARKAVMCHYDEQDSPNAIRLQQVRDELITV